MGHPPPHPSRRPDPASHQPTQPPPAPTAPTDADKLDLVRRLLDLIPDFFYVHDYDVRFQYLNQRATEHFGLPREQILGRRLSEVDPVQGAFFERICREVMDAGVPRLTPNLPYLRRDGTPGVLCQHDIPFTNPVTGAKMIIGMSRDVTHELELQRERERRAALIRELEIARTIQDRLRPTHTVTAGGLDLAAYCRPAEFARGDFYDWDLHADGHVGVSLGDVSGHGVGPALLAASCRAYARVLLSAFPLEEAMHRLNRQMAGDLDLGRFVTFASARVDPASGSIRVLSAGHGPIYLLRAGATEELPTHHAPLGIDDRWDMVDAASDRLDAGDALVLVSDGVFEARREGARSELFGIPRLRKTLEAFADRPAEDIVQGVRDAVDAFIDKPDYDDDVTILVVKRPAQPATQTTA